MFVTSRYLRVEDIAVAYMQLEKSRSMTEYIELAMQTLKDNIYVVDSNLVESGDYFVLRIVKLSMLIRLLSTSNPAFGDGLCEKVYDIMSKSRYQGERCVKWEPFTDPSNGQTNDNFMVNKQWIATVMGTVERAIVDVFDRLATEGNNTRVFYDYNDEKYRVYSTAVRKSLTNPESSGALKFPELKPFSSTQVVHALCMLKQRTNPTTGEYMLTVPNEAVCAIYRPSTAIGVEPSCILGDPHRQWKISTTVEYPIVVCPSMWSEKVKNGEDAKDAKDSVTQFISTLFLIGGGYKGKYISGGGTSAESVHANHFFVNPDATCRIVVPNPHYKPVSMASSIYGSAASTIDVDTDEMFPSKDKELVFTENTNFEALVRYHTTRRVAIDPSIKAIFELASLPDPFDPPYDDDDSD